ncbi:hypothetical protein K0M31_017048 [Melipona bicolor]|uniref:Uncharacterized protein n=1 Tax=Melipona bicolor TaxID=60889 RepID=A0AA40KED2_9HYME|nr:hypothetical protein K0M31_017048 [Melipona bicolor]
MPDGRRTDRQEYIRVARQRGTAYAIWLMASALLSIIDTTDIGGVKDRVRGPCYGNGTCLETRTTAARKNGVLSVSLTGLTINVWVVSMQPLSPFPFTAGTKSSPDGKPPMVREYLMTLTSPTFPEAQVAIPEPEFRERCESSAANDRQSQKDLADPRHGSVTVNRYAKPGWPGRDATFQLTGGFCFSHEAKGTIPIVCT